MVQTLKHTAIVILILAVCWFFIPYAFSRWGIGFKGVIPGDNGFTWVGGLYDAFFIACGLLGARSYLNLVSAEEVRDQNGETLDKIGVQRLEKEIRKSKSPGKG